MLPYVLVSLLTVAQTALMFAVELNRTHATHPHWPGHARFHLVWQNLTSAAFTLLILALLWWPGPARHQRFYLAAAIAAVPLLSFLLAHTGKHLYGGALSDPHGVPPLRLRNREFDGNMAGIIIGLVTLILALAAALVTFQ